MDMQTYDLTTVLANLGPFFAGRAAGHDADDSFVADNYAALKRARIFSAMVPRELGGSGQSLSAMADFLRRLAPYCSSTALALAMHQHLVAAAVWNHRNGKPGAKLLEAVAADEKVLVSTGANDWMSSSGSVERTEGGYLVTAKKPFGSGSPMGAIAVTSAPYDDPEAGPQVLHFPVPLSAEGVSLAGDWQAMGMRGTGSQTLVFDKVFVPEAAVALKRPRGQYHPVWNTIITCAMTLISSVYVGIADAARAKVLEAAAGRDADDVLCLQLGELENRHIVADMAQRDMVRLANDWEFAPTNDQASAILARKTVAIEAARAVADKAVEATGGAAFLRRTGLERLVRDVAGGQFHPLPEKRQQLFTGRIALGRDPVTGEPAKG